MGEDLQRRLAEEKTPLGEPIIVVPLEASDGVAERDEQFMRATRDAAIKEFFFGDAKRTLSPSTQSIGFDDVAIFKATDGVSFFIPCPKRYANFEQSLKLTKGSRCSKLPRYPLRCHIGRSQS
jgi:hypothetical protein